MWPAPRPSSRATACVRPTQPAAAGPDEPEDGHRLVRVLRVGARRRSRFRRGSGEQAAHHAYRGWEGMDRVGQDVERRPGLHREDGLADRVRRPGSGDECAEEDTLSAIDDDRDVARCFRDVARRARRVVVGLLDRVLAQLHCLFQLETYPRRLWIGIRRSRDRAMVGSDVFAQSHPDHHLALIDSQVGVHLRAGRVAGDPAGPEMHTHLAVYQGEMVVRMALGEDVRPDHRAIPRATYTDPQTSGVGLQLEEAVELGQDAVEETNDNATSAPGYIAEAAGHVPIAVERRLRVIL